MIQLHSNMVCQTQQHGASTAVALSSVPNTAKQRGGEERKGVRRETTQSHHTFWRAKVTYIVSVIWASLASHNSNQVRYCVLGLVKWMVVREQLLKVTYLLKACDYSGTVVHACSSSTWEVEAEEAEGQKQLQHG